METSDGKLNSETGTETWAAIKFRSVPVPELPGLVAVPKFRLVAVPKFRRICCLSKSSSIQEFVQEFEEFVKTGENSGRKLIQSYVVRAFRPAAQCAKATLAVPADFDFGAAEVLAFVEAANGDVLGVIKVKLTPLPSS